MPPEGLSDEEIEELLYAYAEAGSYSGAAEQIDRSPSTVKKYVQRAKENGRWDEIAEEVSGSDGDDDGGGDSQSVPDGFTARPPEGVEVDDGPDFENMGYDEFIKWFFNQDGYGVNGSFANTLAKTCEIRGKIPDKAEMANEIMSSNSGVANGNQAARIAEIYWDAAQRFLKAKGKSPGPQGGQPQMIGGSWTDGGGVGQSGGQGGQGGPAGSWVGDQGNGQQPNPNQPQGQWGGQQSQPQQGQGGAGWGSQHQAGHQHAQTPGQMQGQGQGQGGSVDPELTEAIEELRKTQRAIVKQMQGGSGQNTLESKIQELERVNETIEKLQGDRGGGGGEDSQLKRQIAQLEQKLEQQSGQQQPAGGDGMGALVQLASQDKIDPDTLSILADSMGMTDPEVKKAEFDLKKTEKKMEGRRELVDAMMEGLGDAGGNVVASAISSVMGGGGPGGGQQVEQVEEARDVQTVDEPDDDFGSGGGIRPGQGVDNSPSGPSDDGPPGRRVRQTQEMVDEMDWDELGDEDDDGEVDL